MMSRIGVITLISQPSYICRGFILSCFISFLHTVDCSKVENNQPSYCGKGGFDSEGCKKYVNVPYNCPATCDICPCEYPVLLSFPMFESSHITFLALLLHAITLHKCTFYLVSAPVLALPLSYCKCIVFCAGAYVFCQASLPGLSY